MPNSSLPSAYTQWRKKKTRIFFKEFLPSYRCCCCCYRCFHYNFAESFFLSRVEGNKFYWASLSVAIRDDVTYWCNCVCVCVWCSDELQSPRAEFARDINYQQYNY